MLVGALFDSGLDRHSGRSWTTLVSFGLQALAASVLLTLPLLSTQTLPPLSFAAHLLVPVSAPAAPIKPGQRATGTNVAAGHFVYVPPDHISKGVSRDDAVVAAPDVFLAQSSNPGAGFPPGITASPGNSLPVLSAPDVIHRARVS